MTCKLLWSNFHCKVSVLLLKYGFQVLFTPLVTWRCCSPAWTLLNEKLTGGKKLHIKKAGVPEHTHRLRNRHGRMVTQRCLGAKTNSPKSSLWWAVSSCQNELKTNLVSAWFCSKWCHISSFFIFVWSISGLKGQGWIFGPSNDTASLIGMILSLTLLNGPRYTCHLQMPTKIMQKGSHMWTWAKAHLKWTVSKWKSVLWSDEPKFDILVGNHGRVSSESKRRETYQHVINVQFKSQHLRWCGSAYGMAGMGSISNTCIQNT